MENSRLNKILTFGFVGLMIIFGFVTQGKSTPNSMEELQVRFLNVGQGDSTLITTARGHNILIDGGPDKKILDALGRNMKPTKPKIDFIILTHPHADHVAGLNYVLDSYPVGTVYLTGAKHTAPDYLEFLKSIKTRNIDTKKAKSGTIFELDGVSFNFLYPEIDIEGERLEDQNRGSLVLDVSYGEERLLFLGDLPANNQEEFLSSKAMDYKHSIIKISHHGSKTGTLTPQIEKIKPDYAVISVGKNSFGQPAPTTLQQLQNCLVLRTDQKGDITFLVNKTRVLLDQ